MARDHDASTDLARQRAQLAGTGEQALAAGPEAALRAALRVRPTGKGGSFLGR
jgi:hypothetical protein